MALSRLGLPTSSRKGQVEHLGHVAKLPVVRLLAGQTGAVDAALLTGADADDLSVLHVADAVGLGVFERNEAQDQIAFLRLREGLLFRHDVCEHGLIDLQAVSALFEGDAEDLLVLDGVGLVGGVDGDHIVTAALLGLQDLQGRRLVTGGDDAVGDLGLDEQCRGHVAHVAQGDPVAEAAHAVGAAGRGA